MIIILTIIYNLLVNQLIRFYQSSLKVLNLNTLHLILSHFEGDLPVQVKVLFTIHHLPSIFATEK